MTFRTPIVKGVRKHRGKIYFFQNKKYVFLWKCCKLSYIEMKWYLIVPLNPLQFVLIFVT